MAKAIDKLKQRLLCNPKIKMIAFNFPIGIGSIVSLSDILEEQVDPKYFLSEHQMNRMFERGHSPTLSTQATGEGQTETKSKPQFGQTSRIHKKEGISPTVPTTSGGHHIPMVQESADLHQPSVKDCKASRTDGQRG